MGKIAVFLMVALGLAQAARADWVCTGLGDAQDQKLVLEFSQPGVKGLYDPSAYADKTFFYGKLVNDKDVSPLHQQTNYAISPSIAGAGELSFVQVPHIGRGGCGRAGCEDGGSAFKTTSVQLKQASGAVLDFSCEEANQ